MKNQKNKELFKKMSSEKNKNELVDIKHTLTGALISPVDERDWIYESVARSASKVKSSHPSKLDLTNKLGRVFDQGRLPVCAAAVAACCKEWQEYESSNKSRFSTMYVYNQRSNKPDEGMFGRDVMKILLNSGCCRDAFFATNSFTLDKNIPKEAFEDGNKFKIQGYTRVTSIEGLKDALVKYGPCYIAFPVYNEGKHFWAKPKPDSEVKGGHAVTVVGYDDEKKAFRLRNSWGILWNFGGYTWFPYSHFGMQWEIWSMVDAPSPNVPPLPEPKCHGCLIL
jgi:hypothetical protein